MKIFKRTATVMCGLFSLYWAFIVCYALKLVWYELKTLSFDGLVGLYVIVNAAILFLLILSLVASTIVSNITAFKKNAPKCLKIVSAVLLCINAVSFLLIPNQVFVLPYYMLLFRLGLQKISLLLSRILSKWIFFAISVIATTLLSIPPKKEKPHEN